MVTTTLWYETSSPTISHTCGHHTFVDLPSLIFQPHVIFCKRRNHCWSQEYVLNRHRSLHKSHLALLTLLWSSLLFILPSSNWFVPCDWFWAAPREQGFWEEDVFLSAKFMASISRKKPPSCIHCSLFVCYINRQSFLHFAKRHLGRHHYHHHGSHCNGHVYVMLGSQWRSQYETWSVTTETWLAIAVILVWLPL